MKQVRRSRTMSSLGKRLGLRGTIDVDACLLWWIWSGWKWEQTLPSRSSVELCRARAKQGEWKKLTVSQYKKHVGPQAARWNMSSIYSISKVQTGIVLMLNVEYWILNVECWNVDRWPLPPYRPLYLWLCQVNALRIELRWVNVE